MSDRDILLELIKDEALENINGGNIRLSEGNVKASSVVIQKIPLGSIIIRSDLFDPPDSLFKGSKGENKRADFIIICVKDRLIIYLELKSQSVDNNLVAQQLQGAECLLEYIKAVGRFFWRDKQFLHNYRQRYALVYNLGIPGKEKRVFNDNRGDDPYSPFKANKNRQLHYMELAKIKPR